MRCFFKVAAAIASLFCIVVFGAVAFGAENLPDEISVVDAETVDLGFFYSADVHQAQPAGTGAEINAYQGHISAVQVP